MNPTHRNSPYNILAGRLGLRLYLSTDAESRHIHRDDLRYLLAAWDIFGNRHAEASRLSAQSLEALTAARALDMDPNAWAAWALSLVGAP